MVRKPRRLFLYLAIACFAGLIGIFVADGYLGLYDTVYVTVREYTQKIEADYWLRYPYIPEPVSPEKGGATYCCIGADWGQNVLFRYEIENHQFSTYSTLVQASVWQQDEKILDLFSGDVSVGSFDTVGVEWTLSSEELESAGFGEYGRNQFTVIINRGDVERRIIVDFYYPEESLEPPRVG